MRISICDHHHSRSTTMTRHNIQINHSTITTIVLSGAISVLLSTLSIAIEGADAASPVVASSTSLDYIYDPKTISSYFNQLCQRRGGCWAQCFCDDICPQYDDCCQDAKAARSLKDKVLEAAAHQSTTGTRSDSNSNRYWSNKRQQQWICRKISGLISAVKLKASCTAEWHRFSQSNQFARSIQKRCESFTRKNYSSFSPEELVQLRSDPLGSSTPVTDKTNGITYANSYCFQCNLLQVAANGSLSISSGSTKQLEGLIYWSPMVKCSYDQDHDDRNQLYDLIDMSKGRALRYVPERNQWALNLSAISTDQVNNENSVDGDGATTNNDTLTDHETKSLAKQARYCRITPTPPQSFERIIRYCRPSVIDTCPTSWNYSLEDIRQLLVSGQTPSPKQALWIECHFGHQGLTYSESGDAIYRNKACAICNGEFKLHCTGRRPGRVRNRVQVQSDFSSGGPSRLRVAVSSNPNQNQAPSAVELDTEENLSSRLSGKNAGGTEQDEDDGDDEEDDDDDDEMDPVVPSARGSSTLHAPGSFSVLLNLYDLDAAAAAAAGEDVTNSTGALQSEDPAGQADGTGNGTNSSSEAAKHQCPGRTIFDPFLLKCRCLVCGPGRRYQQGRCVSIKPTDDSGGSDESAANDNDNRRRGASEAADPKAVAPPMPGEIAALATAQVSASNSTSAPVSARLVDESLAAGGDRQVSMNGSLWRVLQLPDQQQQQQRQQAEPLVDRLPQELIERIQSGHWTDDKQRRQVSFDDSEYEQEILEQRKEFKECAKINISHSNFCLFAVIDEGTDMESLLLSERALDRGHSSSVYSHLFAWFEKIRQMQQLTKQLQQQQRLIEIDLVLIERSTGWSRMLRSQFVWTWLGSQGALLLVPPAGSAVSANSTSAGRYLTKSFYAYVEPYKLILRSDQFELKYNAKQVHDANRIAEGHHLHLHRDYDDVELLMCVPNSFGLDKGGSSGAINTFHEKMGALMAQLTTYGLWISIASLALYLLLYCLSALDLRNLAIEMIIGSSGTGGGGGGDSWHSDKFRLSRASENSFSTTQNNHGATSLSSRGVACLSGALLVAYSLFLIGQRADSHLPPSSPKTGAHHSKLTVTFTCALLAAATHCAFLFAFNWMLLLSYDIWRTLRLATFHLRAPVQHSQSARFYSYLSLAMASSLLISGFALFTDQTACSARMLPVHNSHNNQPEALTFLDQWHWFVHNYRPQFGQRPGACWFSNGRALALFFGLPMTLVMLCNLLFFVLTSYMVIRTSTVHSSAGNNHGSASVAATPKTPVRFAQHISESSSKSPATSCGATSHSEGNCTGTGSRPVSTATSNGGEYEQMSESSLISVKTITSYISSISRSSSSSSTSSTSDHLHKVARSPPDGATAKRTTPSQSQPTSRTSSLERKCCHYDTISHHENPIQHCQPSNGSNIFSTSKSSSSLAQKYDSSLTNLSSLVSSITKDYRLYCRLSTIMGLTWLTGLLASMIDDCLTLWFLFIILNTLQGLFIFIAFGCKQSKLANMWLLLAYLHYRLNAWRRRNTGSRCSSRKSDLS